MSDEPKLQKDHIVTSACYRAWDTLHRASLDGNRGLGLAVQDIVFSEGEVRLVFVAETRIREVAEALRTVATKIERESFAKGACDAAGLAASRLTVSLAKNPSHIHLTISDATDLLNEIGRLRTRERELLDDNTRFVDENRAQRAEKRGSGHG